MSTAAHIGRRLDAERLRVLLDAWSAGLLPYQAAVQFLSDAGQLRPGHPLINVTWRGDEACWAYLDFFEDDTGELFAEAMAGASNGARAAWILARSLCCGELEQQYWRLDTNGKQSLLDALTDHRE
jgi:hypothetical protein